ncbi:uncharacterized protein B0H18DRAFT_323111 [Fomitopsis serialis]|uniref:uncharacterized protein n=1 Tax=Fomitopsis serialis TaxID=139415 RepID=UPI0020083199|nr:uncharacterized protein B0H18DRAFT_323111 [Neoantrodia serialis]KAH9936418.1 hypothetical protein B0H18DRAFT_323111 [Neoantrodia serialis]
MDWPQWQLTADLVGLIFNWGLLGILCLQTYGYVEQSALEPVRHRAAVYILFLFELVQSILLAVEVIQVVVAVPYVDLFWFSVYIVSPITCAATQCFYAKRIIELSRRHVWSGFIVTFSAGQLIAGIIAGISLTLEQWRRPGPPFALMVFIWLVLSIAADLIIVVSMSMMLSKARWTSYSQSAGIATRLTTIIVETGSLMGS